MNLDKNLKFEEFLTTKLYILCDAGETDDK